LFPTTTTRCVQKLGTELSRHDLDLDLDLAATGESQPSTYCTCTHPRTPYRFLNNPAEQTRLSASLSSSSAAVDHQLIRRHMQESISILLRLIPKHAPSRHLFVPQQTTACRVETQPGHRRRAHASELPRILHKTRPSSGANPSSWSHPQFVNARYGPALRRIREGRPSNVCLASDYLMANFIFVRLLLLKGIPRTDSALPVRSMVWRDTFTRATGLQV